jgi:hypothetical protein
MGGQPTGLLHSALFVAYSLALVLGGTVLVLSPFVLLAVLRRTFYRLLLRSNPRPAVPGAEAAGIGEAAGQTATIEVAHPYQWFFVTHRIWVIVDGKELDFVRADESRAYAIAPGTHSIQARDVWGNRSAELSLEVAAGSRTSLRCGFSLGRVWLTPETVTGGGAGRGGASAAGTAHRGPRRARDA